jgi:hypothetical protein
MTTATVFKIQMLMDYEGLWEQFGWVPPTEIEAYDQDPETGEYVNPQYWVTPWTNEEEKEYEIRSAVACYNDVNGTVIDADDVRDFKEVERNAYCSTYEFTI